MGHDFELGLGGLGVFMLSELFAQDFPGPVRVGTSRVLIDRLTDRHGGTCLEPVRALGATRTILKPDQCVLDLSVPWVHEHVAAVCLRLLGVSDVRAACMTCPPASAPWPPTTGLWTLRWVDGEDGLPRTASWRADAQAGTTAPTTARPCTVRQNDVERARVFSRSSVKAGAIPSLTLNADASHHAALIALVQALDVSVSGRAS